MTLKSRIMFFIPYLQTLAVICCDMDKGKKPRYYVNKGLYLFWLGFGLKLWSTKKELEI